MTKRENQLFQRKRKTLVRGFLVFLLTGLVLGCGNSGPAPIPVEGTITVGGKPMADLLIQFTPVQVADGIKVLNSSGVSDASGKFVLKCDNGAPGAIPGKHHILITDNLLNTDEEPGNKPVKIRYSRVSPAFASPTKSQVQLEVTPGKTNGYDVKLPGFQAVTDD